MTQNLVDYSVQGVVAVVHLDSSPVHALDHPLRAGIAKAVVRANEDDSVQAIVMIGAAHNFTEGTHNRNFERPDAAVEPTLQALCRLIEDSAKPVVAVMAGSCTGPHFELALSAQFRVAHADAKVALPAVKFGLIPEAGGTQRLPRLIGFEPAMNLILLGESVPVANFAGTRLLSHVARTELLGTAVQFARTIGAGHQPVLRTRDIPLHDPQGEAFIGFARNSVAAGKDRTLMPARKACVEVMAAGLFKGFDEGMRSEREAFMRCFQSIESRVLRHVFKAECAAAELPRLEEGSRLCTIEQVGVIGAGTMGVGIAMAFANAGIRVVLLETRQDALDKGLAAIRQYYESSVSKGKVTPQQLIDRIGLIGGTLEYGPLAETDLVIEAVFEDMSVKQKVFRRLDEVCKPEAILASNTSYLDIDKIASFTSRPSQVLGMHFFSPAHVMRLVELVQGAKTAPEVLATCLKLGKVLGKAAVVSGVCDGFIGNRMVTRYGTAAAGLIDAGALPQQVDRALQKFGLAMGPMRMGDLAGLDIGWATRQRRAAEAGVAFIPIVADKLCEAGRLGQKTNAGWYRYEPGSRVPLPDPQVERIVSDYRAERGIRAREVSDEEVVERCIFALVNEGARILEEGIARRASDIDLVYLNGYGFPAHRGGPMFYADTIGLPRIVDTLRRFAAQPGAEPWWTPAPLLLALADSGKTFN